MVHSEETRKKISEAAKRQWADPITRQNALDSFKRRSDNPIWRAKCHQQKTPEHIAKLTEGIHKSHSTPEFRSKMSIIAKARFEDKTNHPCYGTHLSEERKKKQSDKMKGRTLPPFGAEHRRKIGEKHKGSKCTFWKGGVSSFPYCPLFNELLKRRVRAHFNGVCVMCGATKELNGSWSMSVHHVYVEKMTCCENNIRDMDLVRNRFPKNVAAFGSPEFTLEEKRHIRMMVPLCGHCHQKVGFERDDILYEQSTYRKCFTELVNSKYNGICFEEIP